MIQRPLAYQACATNMDVGSADFAGAKICLYQLSCLGKNRVRTFTLTGL